MPSSVPEPQKRKEIVTENHVSSKELEPQPSSVKLLPPTVDSIAKQTLVEPKVPVPVTAADDKEAQKEARRLARQERNEAMKKKQLQKHAKTDNV